MTTFKPHIVAKIRQVLTEVALYDSTHAVVADRDIVDLFHVHLD